jgi:hypothetical protein
MKLPSGCRDKPGTTGAVHAISASCLMADFFKRNEDRSSRFEIISLWDVRFGSKADMCSAIDEVRFTPDSDHESRHAAMVMSALPPKADMCDAANDVGYGPKADIIRLSRRHGLPSRLVFLGQEPLQSLD